MARQNQQHRADQQHESKQQTDDIFPGKIDKVDLAGLAVIAGQGFAGIGIHGSASLTLTEIKRGRIG